LQTADSPICHLPSAIRPAETTTKDHEEPTHMASDKRPPITLACESCKRRNYVTTKNKTNTRERVELKKYCRFCRQHTAHKETR